MDGSDALYDLLLSDPERAWPEILQFVHSNPRSISAERLVEGLIYEYNDRFIDRLETVADQDPVIREVIERASVGGEATKGAVEFWRLKIKIRSHSVITSDTERNPSA